MAGLTAVAWNTISVRKALTARLLRGLHFYVPSVLASLLWQVPLGRLCSYSGPLTAGFGGGEGGRVSAAQRRKSKKAGLVVSLAAFSNPGLLAIDLMSSSLNWL